MILFILSIFRPLYSYHPFGAEYVFNQTLDHFTPSNHQTFPQRYFINSKYFKVMNASIIVYVGGESQFSPRSIENGTIIKIAQQTNSLIAGLEHRFYGKSVPFNDLSTENLRYLTVDQALEDMAAFITFLRKTYCPNQVSDVLIVGGSYAGAFSSWFRLYYPHIANYSWSSSGPINIKETFPEYDSHMAFAIRKYSESCYTNTKLLMSRYHRYISENDEKNIEALYSRYYIPDSVDLYSLLPIIYDGLAYAVQYNNRFKLMQQYCIEQSGDQPNENALVNLFSSVITINHFDILDLDPFQYTKDKPENSDMRAWTWMQCNELGWLSTTAGFISPYCNLSYYQRVCSTIFNNVSIGKISSVARRYGGTSPRSTYVVFTQGEDDPWSTLGVTSIDSRNSQYFFRIKGGSHCDDLAAETEADSSDLKKVRNNVTDILVRWLKNECENRCEHGHCLHDVCLCDSGFTEEFCNVEIVNLRRFWIVAITALVVPVTIMILIGGTAWWLFKRMHEEQFLLSLRY